MVGGKVMDGDINLQSAGCMRKKHEYYQSVRVCESQKSGRAQNVGSLKIKV